jgi:hypothetical protein
MTTKTMYPNPNNLIVTVNGRTYTATAGTNVTGVPLQDAMILEANGWTVVPDGSGTSTSSGSGGVTKRTITGALDGSNMTYTISGAAASVASTLVVSNRGVLEVTLAAGGGDFLLDATGLIYTNNGTALTDVANGGTDTLIIYA